MANKSFGKDDHTWKLQVGQKPSRDEQIFWGDEYNWNSLVPLLWGTVDHPRIRVHPPKNKGDIFALASWWQAPLHLLHFGLGWKDIAKGLDSWRREGYPTENHVLRAVFNTYGSSIEGLEIWLKRSHDWRWGMETALEMDQPVKVWDQAAVELQSIEFERQIHTGPRHQLAQGFSPSWGSDSFHIAGHFTSIARIGNDFDDDPAWLFEQNAASVVLERYRAWTKPVIDGLELYYGGQQSQNRDFLVEVTIVGLGSLGRFAVSPRTGLLFRRSLGQGTFDRDHRWHLEGNSI